MDQLLITLGPTFTLDTAIRFTNEAKSLDGLVAGQPETSAPLPRSEEDQIVLKIEMLEALFSIITLRETRHIFIPAADPGLDWQLPAELSFIPEVVMNLKAHLFKRKGFKPIIKSPNTDCAQTCAYCQWALERLGRGGCDTAYHTKQQGLHLMWPCLLTTFSWPSMSDVKARAEAGCALCSTLQSAFHRQIKRLPWLLEPDSPYKEGDRMTAYIEYNWEQTDVLEGEYPRKEIKKLRNTSLQLWSMTGGSLTNRNPFGVEDLLVESELETIRQDLGIYRPPSRWPLGKTNIQFIKAKLLTPKTYSDPAEALELDRFTPRRLLDLGTSNSAPIRILDSSGLSREALEYATLSYCWGSPSEALLQPKLNQSNSEQFHAEIPASVLSPVILDTVQVCRAIGIRYLWVDALCIAQDDETDWDEQSALMGRIFRNAWVVICSPSSSSCQEKYLERRPEYTRYEYHPPNGDPGKEGVMILRTKDVGATGMSWWYKQLDLDLVETAWHRRGWVFQERLLSPRKVIFGKSMTHVQLDDTIHSENGICSTTDNADNFWWSTGNYVIWPALEQGTHCHEFWNTIAARYSFLHFTNPLDFFPALSGLAEAFQAALQDEYVAGHWLGDLACNMIFIKVQWPESDGTWPQTFVGLLKELDEGSLLRAPSWSWAGSKVSFLINYQSYYRCRVRSHLRSEFTLVNHQCHMMGVNRFGRISSAYLVLDCLMIDLPRRFFTYKGQHVEDYFGTEDQAIKVFRDWGPRFTDDDVPLEQSTPWKVVQGQCKLLLISTCCSGWPEESAQLSYDAVNDRAATADFHLVKIFWKDGYKETFFDDSGDGSEVRSRCKECQDPARRRDAYGLLVHAAKEEGAYYRVGCFVSRAEVGGHDPFRGASRQRVKLI